MTADTYMSKADRAAKSARTLLDVGDIDGACDRAYYAMFNAARAALIASGATISDSATKTHRGLIGAFGLHLVKTNLIAADLGGAINKVERLRLLADYTGDPISLEEAAWAVVQATSFVATLRQTFMPENDAMI
ncbi:HEPN domain-containing protein [Candidatus Methylospira mobilis]|uniref:HEPN domain-containing protein n=2 Tax=Candidatus Methylospira mobilis TaxID=1808979 RepID=A0A5Q0BRS8_9GAMM|nr:HEPN domain-containing protein [Candidatus Methylospira mobilis]